MNSLVILAVVSCAYAAPQAGLVGPSGSIGPSGLVGPSGPVAFHQPAWAFLGHHAHAHVAAHNAHNAAHQAAAARSSNTASLITHEQALANHAAQLAAHRAAEAPFHHAATFQSAPHNAVHGVDAQGCITGPSGKVCPGGNIQFL